MNVCYTSYIKLQKHVPFNQTMCFRREVRHYPSLKHSECYSFRDGAGNLNFRAPFTQNVNILLTKNNIMKCIAFCEKNNGDCEARIKQCSIYIYIYISVAWYKYITLFVEQYWNKYYPLNRQNSKGSPCSIVKTKLAYFSVFLVGFLNEIAKKTKKSYKLNESPLVV
jgi:hypothetical protein